MNRSFVAFVTLSAALAVLGLVARAQNQLPQPPVMVSGVSADDAFNAGVDLQAAKKYTDAIAKYTEATTRRKTFTDAYLNRGICYVEIGDLDKALADFDFFIRRKPDKAEGYIYRSAAYRERKQFELAAEDLKVAEGKNPQRWEKPLLLFHRATLTYQMGDMEKAIQEYSEYFTAVVTNQQRLNPIAYRNRGNAYMMQYNALEKLGATVESQKAYKAAQCDFAEYARLNR